MKTMQLEYLNGHPYRMPKALDNAPYQFLYLSIWMDGMIPAPVNEHGICIENGPDGKGSMVFCLEHADIALLDSGICYASLYREGMTEPVITIALDRESCETVLTSGPDRGHIVFRTPVMGWDPDSYFVVLTNLDKQYSTAVDVLGSAVVHFTVESYYPSYRAAADWNHIRTITTKDRDGEYVIPADDGVNRVSLVELGINGMGGSDVRLFGNGKQSLNIRAQFGEDDEFKDVIFGLYRSGNSHPLWTNCEMVPDLFWSMEMNTWVLDLTPGKYFILIGWADVPVALQGFTPIRPIGGCQRFDFTVLPAGETLQHPDVGEVTITPLSIDIWEQYQNENFASAPCATVELDIKEPMDADLHMIGIRCFDTAEEPVAECRNVKTRGKSMLECFQPLVDGDYRLVLYHNGLSFREGTFSIQNDRAATVSWQDPDADDLQRKYDFE